MIFLFSSIRKWIFWVIIHSFFQFENKSLSSHIFLFWSRIFFFIFLFFIKIFRFFFLLSIIRCYFVFCYSICLRILCFRVWSVFVLKNLNSSTQNVFLSHSMTILRTSSQRKNRENFESMSKHYEKSVLKSDSTIRIIKKNENQNETQTTKKIFHIVMSIFLTSSLKSLILKTLRERNRFLNFRSIFSILQVIHIISSTESNSSTKHQQNETSDVEKGLFNRQIKNRSSSKQSKQFSFFKKKQKQQKFISN